MENGKKREFQGRSMQKCGKFQGAMVISTRNPEGFKNDILNEGGGIQFLPCHYITLYTIQVTKISKPTIKVTKQLVPFKLSSKWCPLNECIKLHIQLELYYKELKIQ